ncbi:hypothetical protein D3C77_719850 [compost metagenome]
MQPGPYQVPATLQRAGIADHFAGLPRDIQQGAFGIIKLHPLQRSVCVQGTRMAPQVFLYRPLIAGQCQWVILVGGDQGLRAPGKANSHAGAGIHRDIAAA